MTTILQLSPPFHVWVPESEDFGLALFLIDYHVEEHLYWVCAMEKTGELWTLSNDKIRMDTNRSIGRIYDKRRISEADRRTSEAQHQAINQLIRDSAPRHDYNWKRVDAPFSFDPETIRGEGPRAGKNSHRAKQKKRG